MATQNKNVVKRIEEYRLFVPAGHVCYMAWVTAGKTGRELAGAVVILFQQR